MTNRIGFESISDLWAISIDNIAKYNERNTALLVVDSPKYIRATGLAKLTAWLRMKDVEFSHPDVFLVDKNNENIRQRLFDKEGNCLIEGAYPWRGADVEIGGNHVEI